MARIDTIVQSCVNELFDHLTYEHLHEDDAQLVIMEAKQAIRDGVRAALRNERARAEEEA